MAASVAVLVAGVVGVVGSLRGGHEATSVAGPAVATGGAPVIGPGPRLTRLPPGFVAATPALAPGVPTPAVYYESPRVSSVGTHESLAVFLRAGAPPAPSPSSRSVVVRGHAAEALTVPCDVLGATCVDVVVTWAEDAGRWVEVRYSDGSRQGDPLTVDQVVAVADGFEHGTGPWTVSTPAPPSASPSALPRTVDRHGQTLVLWQTDALRWSEPPADPRSLPVSVRPEGETPTYCHPWALPVLTAATPERVEVTVGLYVDVLPTAVHPCPASPDRRTATVTLDGPLAGREVVDGSTGRAVTPVGQPGSRGTATP